jgi:hypothetical protein
MGLGHAIHCYSGHNAPISHLSPKQKMRDFSIVFPQNRKFGQKYRNKKKGLEL